MYLDLRNEMALVQNKAGEKLMFESEYEKFKLEHKSIIENEELKRTTLSILKGVNRMINEPNNSEVDQYLNEPLLEASANIYTNWSLIKFVYPVLFNMVKKF